jgi:uncharacterized protein
MRRHVPLLLLISVYLLTSCANEGTYRDSDFGYRSIPPDKPTGPMVGTKNTLDTPDPLDLNKRTHVLLEVDGGGIMGITPALVLARLERELRSRRPDFRQKHLRDLFAVCSGTSTGAIITGMIAAGMPADSIANYYTTRGVELFDKDGRNPFPISPLFRPQFKRPVFQKSFYDALSGAGLNCDMRLRDLYSGPLLLIAAFDLSSSRTLWFRTRDMNDQPLRYNGNVQLVDAISASALSAAFYFGGLRAPNVVWDHWQADGSTELVRGAVFNDGGQGTQNNTLGQTMIQAIMRDWGTRVSKDDQVVVISLGCGNSYPIRDYSTASRLSDFAQIGQYLENEARPEAGLLQWRAGVFLSAHNPNFKVFRFDYVPEPGSSAFSAKLAKDYIAAALGSEDRSIPGIVNRSDFKRLVADLCKVPLAPVGPVYSIKAAPAAKPSLPATGPGANEKLQNLRAL